MKKTLLLLFTLLLALSAQSQNSLRLMTYNIKNANGMDDVCDFQRIADVINHIHPEVVALQELDSMTHRSGQKYVLGEIAGRTQMHAYFALPLITTEEIWYRTSHQRNSRQPENHDTSRTGRSTCADYGRVRQLHLLLHPSVSHRRRPHGLTGAYKRLCRRSQKPFSWPAT